MIAPLSLIILSTYAQTRVNKEWQSDSGLPSTFQWQASATSSDGRTALVGNRQNGPSSDVYISLTDSDGTLLWEQLFDGYGDNDYGSSVGFLNDDVIVGGALFNPTNNDYDAVVLRINDSGSVIWNVIYAGIFGGNDAVTDLVVSGLGNVFVTGASERNGSLSDYHTMKISGTGTILWQSVYDYQSLFDVPAAITVDENENVVVTGGSSDSFSNWDYATVKYDSQGAFLDAHRLETNGMGIDRPAAMSRTSDGSIHITGMASEDGVNYDIKTIKLNSELELQWSASFDEFGDEDEATGMDVDAEGKVYVSGTVTNDVGLKIMVLIKYDVDGNLEWAKKTLPIDEDGKTEGKDVKVVSDEKVVIVGEKTEEGNTNMITIEYDKDGVKQWEKTVDGGNNATDKTTNVKTDGEGNLYVTGKVSDGLQERYTTVKYSTFEKPKDVVFDSTGTHPLFLDHTLIAKFSPDALIEEHINKLDISWAKPEFFLKPEKKQQLEDSTGLDVKNMVFVRLFNHLRTTDTISISRLGEQIRIPEFWSAFMLVIPEYWSVENTVAVLNQSGLPVLEYAEYNRIITTAEPPCDPTGIDADQEADDAEYVDQQSLDPLPYLVAGKRGINVESAWCLETGKPHVRIGVMDSGLEMNHPDFEGPDGNVVSGTYDYYTQSVLVPGGADPGNDNGHGSKVAGIIGAVRNNGEGVAGIAGGDHANGIQGVQLQGHRILNGEEFGGPLFGMGDLEYATEAIVNAATDPLNDPLPDYQFEPVHIMNHSWGIKQDVDNPFNTGLNINRLLYDAIRYSVRNKVLNVVSRGNRLVDEPSEIPSDALLFPACYDDNWVLNVGATGTNGAYMYKENGAFEWFAHIGGSIDLAAPGGNGEVRTLNNLQGTTPFSGTSAAAPHVSGTAGLMLSYKNEPMPDNANLAPEDIEFLMEHTATDAMIPLEDEHWFDNQAANGIGYDDYIGHGRLDAGLAMYYLAEPWYDLRHYETPPHDIGPMQTVNNVTLGNQLGYTNEDGIYIPYGTNYTVEAHEYIATNVHILAPNEQLAMVGEGLPQEAEGIWPRHSSSNLIAPMQPGNVLLPHERILLDGSHWKGYVYHVFQNGVDKGWIPFNPSTHFEPLQFAYSVLVEDLTVGVEEDEANASMSIYPNPGNGVTELVRNNRNQQQALMRVMDMQGRMVFEQPLVGSNAQLDLRHLNAGHYTISVFEEEATTYLPYIKL